MPRYYFHLQGFTDEVDTEGTDLPDRNAVRAEAIRCAGEMLIDIDGALIGEEWRMEVADAVGRPVLSLRFSAIEHG